MSVVSCSGSGVAVATTRAAGASFAGLRDDAAFALQALAGKLAGAADGFCLFAGALLGGFFIEIAQLHFAENAFALKLLLQSLHRLVDIIVANKYLHGYFLYNFNGLA
jgi:hypothetical protein